MRSNALAGLILIVLGIIALSIRTVTYFSTDTVVGPLGFFAWDVSRPHTIFISPMAGVAALIVGILLIVRARRSPGT